VGIVRDLLDRKQAFAAGVHSLIHKPASAVQIERCLRAAYCSIVARRRRKHHREPVVILASVNTRMPPVGEATVVNLSEGGAKLRTGVQDFITGVSLRAGDDVNLRFDCRAQSTCSRSKAGWYGQPRTRAAYVFVTSRRNSGRRLSNGSQSAWNGRFRGCVSGSGKPAPSQHSPKGARRNPG